MVGIVSYSAYIPRYRMDRKEIAKQMGWFGSRGRGERAVANHDEDAITMAVASAKLALDNVLEHNVGGLYLGSMSLPFAHRQNSGVIASALPIPSNIKILDITGSLRAGTQSLISALDSAANGEDYLACASDCRVPKPGSFQEGVLGDAAASFLVGKNNVIAELVGTVSLAADFIDYRRNSDEDYDHEWEGRWIRDEGFQKMIPKTYQDLLEKTGVKNKDVSKIVLATANSGVVRSAPKWLKQAPENFIDTRQDTVGDTGCALPYTMLCDALDSAEAGEIIVVLSFSYGVDALMFKTTDRIKEYQKKSTSLQKQVDRKEAFAPYARYLVYKDILPVEEGIRGESISPVAMSLLWREGKAVSYLEGVRCTQCGTPQFPRHHVCVRCQAQDQMEPYTFVDEEFTVVALTSDYLAFSYDPPQLYGMVDGEKGGRLLLDFTDCSPEEVGVGTKMQASFRRKYKDKSRGVTTYFWKAIPKK